MAPGQRDCGLTPSLEGGCCCSTALSSTCLPCTEQLKAAPQSKGFGSARLSPCSPSQPSAGYPRPTVRNEVILARTCRPESEINSGVNSFIISRELTSAGGGLPGRERTVPGLLPKQMGLTGELWAHEVPARA